MVHNRNFGRLKITVNNRNFGQSKITVHNSNFGGSKIMFHNHTFGQFRITANNCNFEQANWTLVQIYGYISSIWTIPHKKKWTVQNYSLQSQFWTVQNNGQQLYFWCLFCIGKLLDNLLTALSGIYLLSVLLSASVKRVGVSRMQDFFKQFFLQKILHITIEHILSPQQVQ